MTIGEGASVLLFASSVLLVGCGGNPPSAGVPAAAASPSAASPAAANSSSPAASPSAAPGSRADEQALLLAAERGDLAQVRSLLDKGVSPDVKDDDGRTPLTEAAYGGHVDVVKLLIDRGADVYAKKADGATPLSLAKNKETAEVIKKAMDKTEEAEPPSKSAASQSPRSNKSVKH
jgi:hypothetical protein